MIGDQVLDSFVNGFRDEHELNGEPEATLFEHFVNFTVLSRRIGGSVVPEQLATGGAYGIDGLAVIANDQLVTSQEENAEIAKHSLDANFVFVQTKRSSSFDQGDAKGRFTPGRRSSIGWGWLMPSGCGGLGTRADG